MLLGQHPNATATQELFMERQSKNVLPAQNRFRPTLSAASVDLILRTRAKIVVLAVEIVSWSQKLGRKSDSNNAMLVYTYFNIQIHFAPTTTVIWSRSISSRAASSCSIRLSSEMGNVSPQAILYCRISWFWHKMYLNVALLWYIRIYLNSLG